MRILFFIVLLLGLSGLLLGCDNRATEEPRGERNGKPVAKTPAEPAAPGKAPVAARSGAAPAANHEEALKQFVSAADEAANSLKQVRDQASAVSATGTIKQAAGRVRSAGDSLGKLGKATKSESERLKKYDKQVEQSAARFSKEAERFNQRIPTMRIAPQAGKDLALAIQEFAQGIIDFSQAADAALP